MYYSDFAAMCRRLRRSVRLLARSGLAPGGLAKALAAPALVEERDRAQLHRGSSAASRSVRSQKRPGWQCPAPEQRVPQEVSPGIRDGRIRDQEVNTSTLPHHSCAFTWSTIISAAQLCFSGLIFNPRP